jgi:hypothetical protein
MKTLWFEIVENTSSKDHLRWLVCYLGKDGEMLTPPLKKYLAKITPEEFKKLHDKTFAYNFIFNSEAFNQLLDAQNLSLTEEDKEFILSKIRLKKENYGEMPSIDDGILDDILDHAEIERNYDSNILTTL